MSFDILDDSEEEDELNFHPPKDKEEEKALEK